MMILTFTSCGMAASDRENRPSSRWKIFRSSSVASSRLRSGSIQSLLPAMPTSLNLTAVFCRGMMEGGRACLTLLSVVHQ